MSQRWKTFENEASKFISQWLFGDPKVLRRSPCSGGWKGRGSDGDIIVASDCAQHKKDFMFSVEAKCRVGGGGTGWHFEQLLTCPKHEILDWWYQLSSSKPVVEDKLLRLLVFSKASGLAKAFVALGETEVEFFKKCGINVCLIPNIVFKIGRIEDPNFKSEILTFFSFREFFSFVSADKLKDAWRNHNGTT